MKLKNIYSIQCTINFTKLSKKNKNSLARSLAQNRSTTLLTDTVNFPIMGSLIFVQKTFLLGLFLRQLIFQGTYSNWLRLTTLRKQPKTA